MKKILIIAAVLVTFLFLAKIATEVPPEPAAGYAFWLYAERVVECTPTEITLVNNHQTETHLEKDDSWPPCSSFQKDAVLDFYLSRGQKTRFLKVEETAWWRKAM